ncbi:MAG: hypothetical protein C0595_00455 [Marinilabiliales bacterium]|nr:MAG: hypothetical protein C0595_00455 [Marinilabiliales bacterium]
MNYYISKTLTNLSYDEALEKVKEELKKEGFGVLTEIDVKDTLKNKLDLDFKKYKILGACNPHLAHQALQAEDKIGALLPCNVIVEEHENGEVEVSAIDPIPTMGIMDNSEVKDVAKTAQDKLNRVINNM